MRRTGRLSESTAAMTLASVPVLPTLRDLRRIPRESLGTRLPTQIAERPMKGCDAGAPRTRSRLCDHQRARPASLAHVGQHLRADLLPMIDRQADVAGQRGAR